MAEPFKNILKRKIEENTQDHMTLNDITTKKPKPTVNKYFPVNIVIINTRGFNDTIKQHQIIDYFSLMHLDIIGFGELHVTNHNFCKSSRFTSHPLYQFYWSIEKNANDP